MATVTVLTFATDRGAEDALAVVRGLQQRHVITLEDAAIVAWPSGKSPGTKQRVNLATTGGLGGVFWSVLFGLVFFTPLFGLSVGVALGTLGGVLGDVGIDDAFVRAVRLAVTEGTSALFLITSDTIADTLIASLPGVGFNVIATKRSKPQERRLREAVIQH